MSIPASRKLVIWGGLILAVLVVGGLSTYRVWKWSDQANSVIRVKQQPIPVRAVPARQDTIREWVFGEGTCRAVKRDFLTFEHRGKVTFVKQVDDKRDLREGDRVRGPREGEKHGELLARVDVRDFSEQLKVAEAALEQAKQQMATGSADLDKANAEHAHSMDKLQRYEGLYESQVIPMTQLQEHRTRAKNTAALVKAAKARLKSAASGVKAAQAQVNKAKVAMERTSIFAPFDGIVTRINIRKGDYYAPNIIDTKDEEAVLSTIPIVVIKTDEFEITMDLPTFEGVQVKTGQPAAILDLIKALEIQWEGVTSREDVIAQSVAEGEVYSVSPGISPGGRSVQVKVRSTSGADKLRDGMFVTCWICVKEKPHATVVPYRTLVYRSNKAYAFVVNKAKGAAELRRIEEGISGPSMQEILKGVKPGDLLVTDGRHRLVDGAPVKVIQREGEPEK